MPSSLTDVFDKGGISVQSLHEELSQMDRSVFGIKLSEHLRLVATSQYSESAFIFQGSKGTQKVWRAMTDNDMLVLFSAGDSNGAITVSDNANLLLPSTRQLTDELSLKTPDRVLKQSGSHPIMKGDTEEDYLRRLRDWRCHLLSGSHESTSNMLKGVVAWAVNGYTPRETMTVNIVVDDTENPGATADDDASLSMIESVAEDIQYWLSTLHAPATEMTSSLPHVYHTMKVFCLHNAIGDHSAGNSNQPRRLKIKNFDPEHKLRFVIGTSAEFEIWNKGTKNSGQVYVLYGNNAVQHYVDRVQTHASPSKLVTIVQRKGGTHHFTPQKTMEYYKKIMMARSPDHKKVYTHWGCIPESAYITPDGDTARTDYMTTVFRKLLESLRPSQHFDNKGGSAITWGGTYAGVSGGGDCGDEYGVHVSTQGSGDANASDRFEEQATLFTKFLAGQIQQNVKQEVDDEFNTMPPEKVTFEHGSRMKVERNTDNRNDRMRSDTYHVQNFPSMSGNVEFTDQQTTKSNLHWHAGHRCFNNNNVSMNTTQELNLTMSFFAGGLDMLELYEVQHDESGEDYKVIGDSGIDGSQRDVDDPSTVMQEEVADAYNGISKFFPLHNPVRWLSRPHKTNVTQNQINPGSRVNHTTNFITPSPLALLMGAKASGVYGNAFVGEMYLEPESRRTTSDSRPQAYGAVDNGTITIPLNVLSKTGKIEYAQAKAVYKLEGHDHMESASSPYVSSSTGNEAASKKSQSVKFVDTKVAELNKDAVAKLSASTFSGETAREDLEKITEYIDRSPETASESGMALNNALVLSNQEVARLQTKEHDLMQILEANGPGVRGNVQFGDVGGNVQDLARRLIAKQFGKLDFYALDSESMANCTIFGKPAREPQGIHRKSGNEAIAHHLLGDGYKLDENGPSPLTLQRLNKFQHALDFMLSKLHTLFTERQPQQKNGETLKPIRFSEVVRWPPRELGWDGDYTTPPNTMGMPLESMFFGESTCNAELAQAAFNRTVGRNDVFCDLLFPFQSYSMSHLDVPMYEPGFIQAQKYVEAFKAEMSEMGFVNPEHIDPQLLYKESNFNNFGDDASDDIDVMLGDPAFREIMDEKSTGIADTYALCVETVLQLEPFKTDSRAGLRHWDKTPKEINNHWNQVIRDMAHSFVNNSPAATSSNTFTIPESALIGKLNSIISAWGVCMSCSIVYNCLKKQEKYVKDMDNEDEASRKAWQDSKNKINGHTVKDRLCRRVHATRHAGLLAQYYTPSKYMNRRVKLERYGKQFFKKACVNMHPSEKEHEEMLALRKQMKDLGTSSTIAQNAASVQSQTSTEGVIDATLQLMKSTQEFIESEEVGEFADANCNVVMRSYIEPGYTSFAYTAGKQDESDGLAPLQTSILGEEGSDTYLIWQDAIDSFNPENLDVMDKTMTDASIRQTGLFGLRQLPGQNFDDDASSTEYSASQVRSYDITEAYEGAMLKLLRTAQNAFEKPGGYRAQLPGPPRYKELANPVASHDYLLTGMRLWAYGEDGDLSDPEKTSRQKIENAKIAKFQGDEPTYAAPLDSVNPLFKGEWGSQMAPLLSGKHAIGTPAMDYEYEKSMTDELLNALTYNIDEKFEDNFIPKRIQMHVPLISSRPATEKTLSVALPCMIALLVAVTTLDGDELLNSFQADLVFQIKQSFKSFTNATERDTMSKSKQTILADLVIVIPHINYLIEKGLLTVRDLPEALKNVVSRRQGFATNGLYNMDLKTFETDIQEIMKKFSSKDEFSGAAVVGPEVSFAGFRPVRLSSASDDEFSGAAVVGSEVPFVGFSPVR